MSIDNTDTDREEIQKEIAAYKKTVEKGRALQRLMANKDFKLIVTEDYLRDEAVRVVHRLCHPDMQNPVSQAMLKSALESISNLNSHFTDILSSMEVALRNVESSEKELEAMEEGGNE